MLTEPRTQNPPLTREALASQVERGAWRAVKPADRARLLRRVATLSTDS